LVRDVVENYSRPRLRHCSVTVSAQTLSHSRRIALEDLVEQGFDTLINHQDTAVKVLVRP